MLRWVGLGVAAVVLAGMAHAQEGVTREVEGFVGKEVLAFNAEFKTPAKKPVADLNGVTHATKHQSRPFYSVSVAGETYWIAESAFKFKDAPRAAGVPCNTDKTEIDTSQTNSSMGSRPKGSCTPAE